MERGDIIWLDFDPSAGKEIQKRRPAFVVSHSEYTRVTGLAIVVPISSTVRGWVTEVPLPEGMKTSGVTMTEQIRSLDMQARNAQKIETAPKQVTERVLQIIRAYIG